MFTGVTVITAFAAFAGEADRPNPAGFSREPAVSEFRLVVEDSALDRLREAPRRYVAARFRAGDEEFGRIGVQLKGSVGSFRPLDDKPSLTLDLDRFAPGQQWRGTTKIHLNNSVEDPSYLSEWLGSAVFRNAGIPTPEVTHAVVWLNHRRLGLYVVKEGFSEEFLASQGQASNAMILEPETGHDLDGPLTVRAGRTSGTPKTTAGLAALAEAAREGDLGRRWSRLESVIDRDKVVTFLALEILLAHRDGYALARNNYRALLDPARGRVTLLPHGMDQLFQPTDLPWRPHCSGFLARSILETPEGRARYESVFAAGLTNILNVPDLTNRLFAAALRITPKITRHEAASLMREASALADRIAERRANLERQFQAAREALVEFTSGIATLERWIPQDVPEGGSLAEVTGKDGSPALRLAAGPRTSAAWTKWVRLPRGHYRFEGRARTAGVEPLPFGRHHGAALRIGGGGGRSLPALGDTPWQWLSVELTLDAEDTVELLCELRASSGEAWFDPSSLRLVRLD